MYNQRGALASLESRFKPWSESLLWGGEGSKDAAVVRALASHHCGPGSFLWCHMWVEFVVGSCPCSEGFSLGSPVSLPPQKPTLQIPIPPGISG